MKTMLLLIALIALLAGCGPKNIVGPTQGTTPALSNQAEPSKVPYYAPLTGEPHRGTDPDLGPTG